MNHTVNAADVDKCAVIGKRLNNADSFFADFGSVGPEVVNSCLAFFFKKRANRADSSFSLLVNLDYSELNFFSEKVLKIVAPVKSGKRSGNKYSYVI